MDKIRILPDGVANQIAAGEVVGRPASVVKELMENAVDAGSSLVTVNFRDGGVSLIQVVDNGCGMSEADSRLAFERHATSKIQTAEDLYRLGTFGFRGEALPSIASVSELELRTRTAENELGTRVVIRGGAFVEQLPMQTPQGTQLLVKNLFYNVPARRRFLKEPHVEARYLVAEFQRVALCNPHIAFTLCENDNPRYTLPVGNLRQRISGVHGKRVANNLLEVSVDTSLVRIEGFVGHPAVARKTTAEQYLFVNGRYFRSASFHKAICQAYEKLIPGDTKPPYFIHLTIDSERIDVNVHPAKTEVKFDDEQTLRQILTAAVRESLGKLGVAPQMDFEMDTSIEIPVYRENEPYKVPDTGFNPAFNPFASDTGVSGLPPRTSSASGASDGWDQLYERDSAFGFGLADEGGTFPADGADRELDSSLIEFISGEPVSTVQNELEIDSALGFRGMLRLGARYCATVLGDALVVVDLGRAYERVLYERYLTMIGNNASVSQQLLFPERVELGLDDRVLLERASDELAALGFDCRFAQGGVVEVTGLPPELSAGMIEETLYELAAQLRESSQTPGRQRLEQLAAVMAHRGASSQHKMMDEAVTPLLDELSACREANYTPGGLPIAVVIGPDELRQRFK